MSTAAGNSAITETGAYSPLVGNQVCSGNAPALVTAAVIRSKNAMIESAESVGKPISEMTNVPLRYHIINTPSIKAASEAPIIAKLLVAAKLEFLPPVAIRRYSDAVTISQNMSKNNK